MLLTQKEISEKLKLSKGRISQLKKEGRLNFAMAKDPISNKIKFDLKKVLEVLSKDQNIIDTDTDIISDKNKIESTDQNNADDEFFKIDDNESYDKARTRKMQYSAELERLEVEELSGRLVDGNKVKKDFYEIGKRIKESLLNIPNRLSSQLVSLHDRNEIYSLLTEEIEIVLRELSNDDYT